MTTIFKESLAEIKLAIDFWNSGKIATEEEFIDILRPSILKITKEIESPPEGSQTLI